MNIGYGSRSYYDSLRGDLFYDKDNNTAYFNAYGNTYSIKLSSECISLIEQNKKIWITLTQLPPSQIDKDTLFDNPTIEVL